MSLTFYELSSVTLSTCMSVCVCVYTSLRSRRVAHFAAQQQAAVGERTDRAAPLLALTGGLRSR